jgi:serine protease
LYDTSVIYRKVLARQFHLSLPRLALYANMFVKNNKTIWETRMRYSSVIQLAFTLTLLSALAACGGGGGGGGGSSGGSTQAQGQATPTTYALSGSILLPGTATVDNDTNDPDQAGWASNDTDANAQTLTSPVQLVGSLNIAGKGPAGKTYAAGDLKDIFKVNLVAGQVIELVFAGSTADNDIDLLLFDVGATTSAVAVGSSSSTSSNRECIAVTRNGNYFVMPWIRKGAAIYSLNISAVGDGASCGNTASGSALFAAGALIAKEKPLLDMGIAGSFTPFSTTSPSSIPKLLNVPAAGALLTTYGIASVENTRSARDADIEAVLDTLRHAKDLMDTGKYAYVEPNFYLQSFSYAPDDPRYSDQRWHFEMINQPSAMDRIADLSLINARRPIVAVVDDGFTADHPDITGQIVDAYTFAGTTTKPGAESPQRDCGTFNSNSFCFHGFFVAGIATALANNGQFGASVAPVAQLMPIQTTLSNYDVIQGMLYASGLPNSSGTLPSRKADVINMSFGGSGVCPAALGDVITQARAQNVLVVGASGNTTGTGPHPVAQPANCPGVISVGALDYRKTRAAYSGYGTELSLVAPGGGGTSAGDVVWSITPRWLNNRWEPAFAGGTGTSFATPHVVGVLALMRYVYPDLTVAQVDTLLASGKLTDDLGNPGRDDEYGQGIINARKAVDEAISLASGANLPGIVLAVPTSISLGSNISSASLRLGTTAVTSETILSITASHTAITVTPGSNVGSTTRLGDYTVSVDRNLLPVGFHNLKLTITTSSRSLSVPVSVVKLGSTASPNATLGSMWVQATNLDTGAVTKQKLKVSSGKYNWSFSGISAGRLRLIASTDLNNDGVLCDAGEACADYPGNGQLLQVGSDLSGLDFSVAPILP